MRRYYTKFSESIKHFSLEIQETCKTERWIIKRELKRIGCSDIEFTTNDFKLCFAFLFNGNKFRGETELKPIVGKLYDVKIFDELNNEVILRYCDNNYKYHNAQHLNVKWIEYSENLLGEEFLKSLKTTITL